MNRFCFLLYCFVFYLRRFDNGEDAEDAAKEERHNGDGEVVVDPPDSLRGVRGHDHRHIPWSLGLRETVRIKKPGKNRLTSPLRWN